MIGEIPISDACHYMDAHDTETKALLTLNSIRKTLDWGGKGGKGGGNEGAPKMLCTTPYVLVIAERMRSFLFSVIILSRFLDRLLVICEAQKCFLNLTRNKNFLINFSFLDSALKSRSFHVIIQTLHSFPPTHTIVHYYTLLYTIIHYYFIGEYSL